MHVLVPAFWAAFEQADSPEERGMRLLRAHLTAAQREQFERCSFFEVIGGQTGRRYRVHRAHIINIEELDATGCCTDVSAFLHVGIFRWAICCSPRKPLSSCLRMLRSLLPVVGPQTPPCQDSGGARTKPGSHSR